MPFIHIFALTISMSLLLLMWSFCFGADDWVEILFYHTRFVDCWLEAIYSYTSGSMPGCPSCSNGSDGSTSTGRCAQSLVPRASAYRAHRHDSSPKFSLISNVLNRLFLPRLAGSKSVCTAEMCGFR